MAQFTTTYAALIALLGSYVEDDSTEFTSAVQGIVNRAEERVLRDLDLAIFDQSTVVTTTPGTATSTAPATDAVMTSLFFTASGQYCELRSYDFVRAYGDAAQGRPLYYAEYNGTFRWAPIPDAAYAIEVRRYVRPTPLSPSNTSNWVSVNAADALLHAALVESESFLIAPERVQEFAAHYAATLGPLRAQWRKLSTKDYEPIEATPEPERTR